MYKSALLLFFLFQVGTIRSYGVQIEVPKDYKSIGEALKQAKEGDRVVVSPGTYFERIKIPNGVTLRSSGMMKRVRSDWCGTRDSGWQGRGIRGRRN